MTILWIIFGPILVITIYGLVTGKLEYRPEEVFPDGADSPAGQWKIQQFKIALALNGMESRPMRLPLAFTIKRKLKSMSAIFAWRNRYRHRLLRASEYVDNIGGEAYVMDCLFGRGAAYHLQQFGTDYR